MRSGPLVGSVVLEDPNVTRALANSWPNGTGFATTQGQRPWRSTGAPGRKHNSPSSFRLVRLSWRENSWAPADLFASGHEEMFCTQRDYSGSIDRACRTNSTAPYEPNSVTHHSIG